MRLNAKTKRLKRTLNKKSNKKLTKVLQNSVDLQNQLKEKAAIIPYIANTPKQNPGHAPITLEEIAQSKLDAYTAIAMDAKAAEQTKYRQKSKRGIRTSPVIIISGTDNNFCHPKLAAVLSLMKTSPAMRPMYSSHLRSKPYNKRGKFIRPKLIFTRKGEGFIPQHKATKQDQRHLVYPQL